jgi:hypothetical protein
MGVIVYGLGATLGTALACSAVSLRSFLSVPLWVVFIPAVLVWIACGVRGFEPEGMMGVGGISLVGGPLIASKIVGLPLAAAERWAVGFNVIRNSLATTLVVLLPLCLMSLMLGSTLRGAMESGALRFTRR